MLIPELLVMLDVDNTLLDNDAVIADMDALLLRTLGEDARAQYWRIYESLRERDGYVDYLGALQGLRNAGVDSAAMLGLADGFLDYPFAERLYPGALAALAHLRTLAPVAILTDGDIVFQPRKIRRAGLEPAVDGRVQVCVHKEREISQWQQALPARHYVMVDDKPKLLAAMKSVMGTRLTTIWVRQGHYAREGARQPVLPAPDRSIDAIAQLRGFSIDELRAGSASTIAIQETP